MKLNQNLIDEVSGKFAQILQSGPMKDAEQNVRALIQGLLQKLDLVTREEFDVQQQVLLRTREQLQALEQRVVALEQQLSPVVAVEAASAVAE